MRIDPQHEGDDGAEGNSVDPLRTVVDVPKYQCLQTLHIPSTIDVLEEVVVIGGYFVQADEITEVRQSDMQFVIVRVIEKDLPGFRDNRT